MSFRSAGTRLTDTRSSFVSSRAHQTSSTNPFMARLEAVSSYLKSQLIPAGAEMRRRVQPQEVGAAFEVEARERQKTDESWARYAGRAGIEDTEGAKAERRPPPLLLASSPCPPAPLHLNGGQGARQEARERVHQRSPTPENRRELAHLLKSTGPGADEPEIALQKTYASYRETEQRKTALAARKFLCSEGHPQAPFLFPPSIEGAREG